MEKFSSNGAKYEKLSYKKSAHLIQQIYCICDFFLQKYFLASLANAKVVHAQQQEIYFLWK